MTQTYYLDYTSLWASFLTEKGYKFVCGDADIIAVELPLSTDDRFIKLFIEYAQWLKDSEHDMTIHPNADGSRYHRG